MTQVTTQVDDALDFDEDESPAAPFWGRLIPIVVGSSTVSTIECLTLTADEHIVSRSSKQGDSTLVIANPRISSRHAKFMHTHGSDPVLEDLSTNGTWVNGERLGKGNERILKTGDTVAFINPADTAANADGTTTFTFIVAGASEPAGGTSAAATSSSAPGSSSDEAITEADAALVTCSICQEILHRAVALQPCLHNFCGGCASTWLKKKPECPECRTKVAVVARNHTLISLVEAFVKKHPSRARAAADTAELDAQDKVGSTPWNLKKRKNSHAFGSFSFGGNDDDDDNSGGSDSDDDEEDDGSDEDRSNSDEEGSDEEGGGSDEDAGSEEGDSDDGEEAEPHPPTLTEQHEFLDVARAQNFSRVRELVRANRALVNVQPSGRWTALHQAALVGNRQTVRFLMARGASTGLVNRNGQTARQVALSNGHLVCAADIV